MKKNVFELKLTESASGPLLLILKKLRSKHPRRLSSPPKGYAQIKDISDVAYDPDL